VVAGDSISGIASRYRVSVGSLLAANGLTLTSVILPGQQLSLPAGAAVRAGSGSGSTAPSSSATSSGSSSASGATHRVVAGDSLYGIASRYRVRLAALLEVNQLTVSSVILPGRVLSLPAGATVPAGTTASTSSEATSGTDSPSSTASGNARIDAVVQYALAQEGKPYEFFTKGPDSFDCSGLAVAAYAQAGVSLFHWSAAQALQGAAVDLEHDTIRAGDLVFQRRRGSDVINHVGIAIDSTRWIQAVGPGLGVRVGRLPATSTIATVHRYIDA